MKTHPSAQIGTTSEDYLKYSHERLDESWNDAWLLAVPTVIAALVYTSGEVVLNWVPDGFYEWLGLSVEAIMATLNANKLWAVLLTIAVTVMIMIFSRHGDLAKRKEGELFGGEADAWTAQNKEWGRGHILEALDERELEVADTLLRDGFQGSVKDLITVSKGLS